MLDILIVGAGPIGLACGIAAKRAGLIARIVEKGALTNSVTRYPTDLEFFSTPELLEIGNYPFTARNYKPVRAEALEYYRQVAQVQELDIRLYEAVTGIEGRKGEFRIATNLGEHHAKNVIIATGFFDIPRMLNVPGEDRPKVSHYYHEPYPYVRQEVLVIGARNSAAKAALDAYRHGANVTIVVRGPELSSKIKYWIKPDLENRIRDGNIKIYYNSTVVSIQEKTVTLNTVDGKKEIRNDWVLAMTGYQPDFSFLEKVGIELESDEANTPKHDRITMETNRPGVYLAGVVCGGLKTNVWFIENSRVHADQIVKHITGQN